MGKRKVTKAEDEEAETPVKSPAAADEAQPKKKRAPKKTPEARTEPWTDDLGWTIHPPSLIYKAFGDVKPAKKIAAFDFDGTLCTVSSRSQWPKDENDFKLFNKRVPKMLQQFADEGYQLVVFSNQNGIKAQLEGKMATKVKKRVENVLQAAAPGLPMQVFLAAGQDEYRKPQTGMWDFFSRHCNGAVQPDAKQSFFVGDAAGRTTDFAASDKEFAASIGMEFKTPEDVFGEGDAKKPVPTSPGTGGGLANPDNAPLVAVFEALAAKFKDDRWKAVALNKVSKVLTAYPDKIVSGKQVAKLQGVGKASIAYIDEFLTHGKCAALEEEGEGEAFQPAVQKKQQSASMALKFI